MSLCLLIKGVIKYIIQKPLLLMIPVAVKRIVHFEINFRYVLAYLKGIQDVGVFVSAVF